MHSNGAEENNIGALNLAAALVAGPDLPQKMLALTGKYWEKHGKGNPQQNVFATPDLNGASRPNHITIF